MTQKQIECSLIIPCVRRKRRRALSSEAKEILIKIPNNVGLKTFFQIMITKTLLFCGFLKIFEFFLMNIKIYRIIFIFGEIFIKILAPQQSNGCQWKLSEKHIQSEFFIWTTQIIYNSFRLDMSILTIYYLEGHGSNE